MKKKLLGRMLGLFLAVSVMGTSLAPSVQAAELQIEMEENVVETTEEESAEKAAEPESVVEEEPAEEVVDAPEVVEEPISATELSSTDEVAAYLEANPANGLRLLVVSESEPSEFYGATSVVTYDGVWMIAYENTEALNGAYEAYSAEGLAVEKDESVEAYEDDEIISELTPEDVPQDSVETQAEEMAQVVEEEELNVEKDILVAIIDTGVDTNDALLEGRLSAFTDENMSDANGHGTIVAEIVASQTAENVQILPIAAFDESGKSSVAKLYFAMKEAMEQGADVINISACGAGESKVLNSVIAQASARDIVVVVAAGNEGSDTAGYMPANVSDAITVSAVDKECKFAAYSNYGEGVDFSAMGILVKDMGTADEGDDLIYMGTSISSAYVSSYAALLLAESMEADVYASFLASATDLGEEGFDPKFGYGYLQKDNIVAVIREEREKKELEEEDLEDELEEEGDEKLYVAGVLENVYGEHNFLNLRKGQISDSNGKRRDQFFLLGGDPVSDNGASFSGRLYKDLTIGGGVFYLGIESGEFGSYEEAKEHFDGSWRAVTGCPESGDYFDIHQIGNGNWQYNVGKHNTNRKVVFNNCTFGSCYFECYFDVEFRNCTFTNCHIQSNGRGNQTYINCTLSGNDDWGNTYYREDRGMIYSGTIGGNCCEIKLQNTIVKGNTGNVITNGDGGTHGKSSIIIMDGSEVYGDQRATKAVIRDIGNVTCEITVQDSLVQTGDAGVYVSYKDSVCTIGSGAVINDMKRGINNKGTTRLHGGTIQGGRGGVTSEGVYNENILEQSSGIIRNYTIGINNRNTYTLYSGDAKITANKTGVVNAGTMTQHGAFIESNSGNGVENSGNLTMNNGYVRNNGNRGVDNSGTMNMAGNVQVYGNKTGVYNAGTMTQNNGNIYSNSGNGVENNGIYTKNGGFVTKNGSWGIYNNATTYLTSSDIKENKGGGVYQNGTFVMSGNAAVTPANVIYLTKGKVVTVDGTLRAGAGAAGCINTASGDRKTGRQLIQLKNNTQGESTASKFSLAFNVNDDTHPFNVYSKSGSIEAAKGSHVMSDIRAGYGTDQNAPTDQIILSGWYYSDFMPNLATMEGMTVKIPWAYNKLLYGEKYLPDTPSHAYTTGAGNKVTVEVTLKDGTTKDISDTLVFKGWAEDPNETDEGKIYTTDQVLAKYGDFHWYAIWDAKFDILFDGNGQDQGENYRKDNIGLFDTLPGNVGPSGNTPDYFEKEDVYKAADQTWYDENKEAYVDHVVPYSYQGWSLRDDAIYTDADVVNPKNPNKDTLAEILGITSYNEGAKWLSDLIKNGDILGYDDEGRAIIPVYVVWDRSPEIEAYDIYITRDEIDSLTEGDLWENVTARDLEDGTLKNQVDVTVIDFDKDALKELEGDRGGVSITYKAVDGAGNVTFYDVIIMVTSNTAITSWTTNADGSKRDTANYVRFIDRENYNKARHEDGGMEEYSVWYKNPEYVSLITSAFDNLESKGSVISYELDVHTMQDMQSYIRSNFDQVLEPTYRTNFYDTYMTPHIKSGSIDHVGRMAKN